MSQFHTTNGALMHRFTVGHALCGDHQWWILNRPGSSRTSLFVALAYCEGRCAPEGAGGSKASVAVVMLRRPCILHTHSKHCLSMCCSSHWKVTEWSGVIKVGMHISIKKHWSVWFLSVLLISLRTKAMQELLTAAKKEKENENTSWMVVKQLQEVKMLSPC